MANTVRFVDLSEGSELNNQWKSSGSGLTLVDWVDATAATAATAATVTVKNLTMAAIRANLPQYFNADIAGLVTGLSDNKARISMLAHALTGAGIERAQSGNMPKSWATVDSAALSLKGSNKTRVQNALAHILTVKPASEKHGDIANYETFATGTLQVLTDLLTPVATTPKTSDKETPKQTIARLEAELLSMTIERNAYKAQLEQANIVPSDTAALL